jgi:hypothetical protein
MKEKEFNKEVDRLLKEMYKDAILEMEMEYYSRQKKDNSIYPYGMGKEWNF